MIDDLVISTGHPIYGEVRVNNGKRLINEKKLIDSEPADREQ